jgi:hypothetical protein
LLVTRRNLLLAELEAFSLLLEEKQQIFLPFPSRLRAISSLLAFTIETGQEVDRSDINLRGGLAAQAEMLRRAFTLEELEAMDAKLEAAKKAPKLMEAPAAEPGVKEQERPTSSSSESSFGRAKLGPSETGLDVNGHVNGKESWR